jgi:tetratricopeptide (TPR) repeat protein
LVAPGFGGFRLLPYLFIGLGLLVLVLQTWNVVTFGLELYTGWTSSRIRRLRRRGEIHRALRLAERLVWLNGLGLPPGAVADPTRLSRQAGVRRRVLKYVNALTQLASLRSEVGDFEGARELHIRCCEMVRNTFGESSPEYGVHLGFLGGLYLAAEQYATARPVLEQAASLLRALRGSTHPETAIALINLGVLFFRIGDYAAAIRTYELASEALAPRAKQDPDSLVLVLSNLGGAHQAAGNISQALDTLRRAVELSRSALGERNNRSINATVNLACCLEKAGQFEDAVTLLREAVRIRAEALGAGHRAYYLALNNLAFTLSQTGELDAPRLMLDEVLSGVVTYGEQHTLYPFALAGRGILDARAGRTAGALEWFAKAAAADRRMTGRIFSVASDTQRLAYLQTLRRRLFFFLSLVRTHLSGDPTAVAAALDLVLTRKALAAEATAARRDAVLGGRYPHLAEKLRELSTLRQAVAAEAVGGPGDERAESHRKRLAEWLDRQTALEVELARAIPEVGLQQQLQAVDRRAVAAALPPRSILVEFVRVDLYDFTAVPARGEAEWKPARYLAFVLRPDAPDAVRMIDLGEAEPIDRQIAAFRALLGGAGPDRGMVLLDDTPGPSGPATGAALAAVIESLCDAIGTVEHVVLAIDG